MNSLSWLIYFIGVVGNLDWFFSTLTILLLLVCIGLVIAFFMMLDEDVGKEAWAKYRKCCLLFVPAFIVCFLISSLMPSRQTLILIAGSEIGQEVVQSKAVQDVVNPGMDLLKAWIATETTRLKDSVTKK